MHIISLFFDPFLEKPVSFTAPLPEDIRMIIIKYGLDFDINLLK